MQKELEFHPVSNIFPAMKPDDLNALAALDEPRAWLVEPDPALLRAGLTADAAVAFGGAQLEVAHGNANFNARLSITQMSKLRNIRFK